MIFTLLSNLTKNGFDINKIFNKKAKIEIDSSILDKINEQFEKGVISSDKYVDAMNSYEQKVKDVANSAEQVGIKSAISAAGVKVLDVALNALTGIIVGLIASAFISWIEDMVHANEKAIEAVNKLNEEFNDFKETNSSNIQTLKELKSEFEQLSKGVDDYGNNLTLTTEQYERYKSIVEDVVEISPQIAEGYDIENGYIVNKNDLIERTIELQEQEYRNELRKIITTDKLTTAMSGYLAEYKEALGTNGTVLNDGSFMSGNETAISNSMYKLFNTNNRADYSNEDMDRQILSILGKTDEEIESIIKNHYNEYGYYQSGIISNYINEIISNVPSFELALTPENVELDESTFNTNMESFKTSVDKYNTMLDGMDLATENMQSYLKYIAEYTNEYSNLSTYQNMFVQEYLKSFTMDDIASVGLFGNYEIDETKLANVKVQIQDFIKSLSTDTEIQNILNKLYTMPTDTQSANAYYDTFISAFNMLQSYCDEHGIEIPVELIEKKNEYQEVKDNYVSVNRNAAQDFSGQRYGAEYQAIYQELDTFANEQGINSQDEVAKWNNILQAVSRLSDEYDKVAEAKKRYLNVDTESELEFSLSDEDSEAVDTFQSKLETLNTTLNTLSESGKLSESDWIDLIQEFPELEGKTDDLETAIKTLAKTLLDDLIESLEGDVSPEFITTLKLLTEQMLKTTDQTETLDTAYEKLITKAKLVKQADEELTKKGKIYNDTLIDIASNYPELETAIAKYQEGLITQSELFELLKEAYETDADNYETLVENKLLMDSEFYESVVEDLPDWITDLADSYGIDLGNYKSLCEAKLDLEKQLAEKRAAITNALNNEYITASKGVDTKYDAMTPHTDIVEEYHEKYKQAQQEYIDIETILNSLDTTFETKLDFQVDTDYKSLGKDDDDKDKDADTDNLQEIDWAEEKIKKMSNTISEAEKKLENAKGFKAQKAALEDLITTLKNAKNEYENILGEYETRYSTALSKLPKSIQNKIIKGNDISLEEYDSDTAENIQDALNWKDKIRETKNTIADYEIEISDYENVEASKLRQEHYQSQLDLINTQLEDSSLSVKEKNKLLRKQLSYQTKINNELIAQAKYEKNAAEASRLAAEDHNNQVQNKLERLQNWQDSNQEKIELYETTLDDKSLTAKQRKKYINKLNSSSIKDIKYNIKEELVQYDQEALLDAVKKVSNNKVQTIDLKYITDDENLSKILKELNDDTLNQLLQLLENKEQEQEENYFNDVVKYNNDLVIQRNNNKIQDIQNKIDKNGGIGTEEQYTNMVQYYSENRKELVETKKYAQEMRSLYKKGQEGWQYWDDIVQECQNDIAQCDQNIKECHISILKLPLNDVEKKLIEINSKLREINNDLEDQTDYINAATAIFDIEIEAQEDLKEIIQDKIDALQEENELREANLAVQKAEYELEKAKNQKTSKIFREGQGFVYESDADTINNAQESYDSAVYNQKIAVYQQQIDAYDKEIERLNEMKEKWTDISTESERLLQISKAIAYDSNFVSSVLAGDEGLLNQIKNTFSELNAQKALLEEQQDNYTNLQDAINDIVELYSLQGLTYEQAQQKVAEAIKLYYPDIVGSYEDEAATLEEVAKKKLEEAGVVEETSQTNVEEVEESNIKIVESYQELSDSLSPIFTSMETMMDNYVKKVQSMASSVVQAINTMKAALAEAEAINNSSSNKDTDTSNNSKNSKNSNSSNSNKNTKTVKVETAGKSHSGLELGYIGESNGNRDKDAFKYIALNELSDDEVVRVLQKSEGVITESQIIQTMDNFRNIVNYKVPSIPLKESSISQSVNFSGDIVVNTPVGDSSSFAREIKKNIGNAMLQELYKK